MNERQIATLESVLKEAAAIVIPVGEGSKLQSLMEEANTLLQQGIEKAKSQSAFDKENCEGSEEKLRVREQEALEAALNSADTISR